jgi:hypothetical protein
MIARLMNEICMSRVDILFFAALTTALVHSRFINLYGQSDCARLARNQSTLPESAKPDSKMLRVLSAILLHQPHRELNELKDLWVDKIVYTEHWRTFLGTQMKEWKSISLLVCFR